MSSRKKTRQQGFTVIEILAVVVIISLLAAFVVPKIFKGMGQAKTDIARSKMAIVEGGLGKFYLDNSRYPSDSEGLDALLLPPPGVEEKWNGPYVKKSDLLDPWDKRYLYQAEGQINLGSFDLVSYGADGTPGGEGENADIVNE